MPTTVHRLALVLSLAAIGGTARAEDTWRIVGGTVTLRISPDSLISKSQTRAFRSGLKPSADPASTIQLQIESASDLKVITHGAEIDVLSGEVVVQVAGSDVASPATPLPQLMRLRPEFTPEDTALGWVRASDDTGRAVLLFRDTLAMLDPLTGRLTIRVNQLMLGDGLAEALGRPGDREITIGTAVIHAHMEPIADSVAYAAPMDSVGGVAGGTCFAAGTGVIGPDVIVGDLVDIQSYPPENGISAFAVGTDSCNAGDEPANWIASTPDHPVISQSMYRLQGTRFEQIGMSWLKHGFAVVCQDKCGFGMTDLGSSLLGCGCSDLYGTFLNGLQSNLGPRTQVNPLTGAIIFPRQVENPRCDGCGLNERRLQVHNADLDNAGALYFVEAQYVTADDAQSGNGLNNASYRPMIFVNPVVSCPIPFGVEFCARVTGSTVREAPAISAWSAADAEVVQRNVQVANEGMFIVSARASFDVDVWRYDYAIQNLNSHRGAASFSVPLPFGVSPTAVLASAGFHDVDPHSGEPYETISCGSCRNDPGKRCFTDINCPTGARGPCLPSGVCENNAAITCTIDAQCPFVYAPCDDRDALCFDGVCDPTTKFCRKPACLSDADCFGFPCDVATGLCDNDWRVEVANGAITWSTSSFDVDPLANALQWGTLYNFWFSVDTAPDFNSTASIGLFRPDCPLCPDTVAVRDTVGPTLELVDCNGNGVADVCDISCDIVGCLEPCGMSGDCNNDGRPDECEQDCNSNTVPDNCELIVVCVGGSRDGLDCMVDADCDTGTCVGVNDCDRDGFLDDCEADCDGDGIPDDCDPPQDTDQDGITDCLDECPDTSPPGSCLCPEQDCCIFPGGAVFCQGFTRDDCFASGGTPLCVVSPCRNGCLVGDFDRNGVLDFRDAAALMRCYSGGNGEATFVQPSPECLLRFDFNDDLDVDRIDVRDWIGAAGW